MDDEQLLQPFLDKLKSEGTQSMDMEYQGYRIKAEPLVKNDMHDDLADAA